MIDVPQKRFLSAAKGKIIIGFTFAFFALFLAWGVSKIAFDEMLETVDTISTPNAKLRLVNQVSRKVAGLDQQQKNSAFNSPGNDKQFFKDSRQLRALLDSLGNMYITDSLQFNRIKSIEKLLVARDKQFVNYLKVRERLINNKAFTDEVQRLNELASRPPQQQDSTIVTSEKKTSTVTILPVDESVATKRKSFFNRLFAKKKEEEEARQANKSYQVTNEEKVQRDTIALSGETVIAKDLEQSLRTIAKEQRLKSERFLNREAVLANANEVLIRQMLDILRKVESEVLTQIEENGIQAKAVVNTGINRISIIMIGFFLLTVVLLYLILTDITRSNLYRKELEEARDEAEYHGMAKQRFLSNMSHEIRTPLQSIIGYAEIIRNQDHPKLKDIEAIFHSSEHLLQIVNEILDYNRIISGKFTFQKKPFNIRELLDEVISVMEPQAEHKKLLMKTEIALQGIEFIEGDAFRLKQILYNLMSNAIKFTQKGEVLLTVFYKRQKDNLHFTFMVKDTGIGLSEEQSSRVFNEFEQIDSPDKEVINKAGAGLGLTIIKSLVENQDGRIYVKSKPGEGSTFTVYLTFKVTDVQRIESLIPAAAKRLNVRDKVWVVDDDQLILDLCEIIFRKKGIPHLCFNAPKDMLAASWDSRVKYILMDMRMPEISGVELCHMMKERIPADVKIFAMTAQVLPEELEAVLAHGFDGLIMKPFRENDLLAIFATKDTDDALEDNVGAAIQEAIILDDSVARDINMSAEEELALDISMVEKMTFGDQEMLLKILNRFKDDCVTDMQELEQSVAAEDLELSRLIVHRIAGRTAQMGSAQLASEFRTMEIEFAEADEIDDEHREQVALLISKLSALTNLVDLKIG